MLSFEPVFPRLPGGASLADVVEFERVRVVLRRADGSVALDTTVLFPVGADSVVLAASVTLSPSSGSGGEKFKLDLGYMNAAGEVVFRGGPVDLTVVPKGSGNQPTPVQIPVRYSGPGASATRVVISPRSLSVIEGQPFAFTAVATDASGTAIPNTPIVWASLDPTRAVLSSSGAGAGRALGVRGNARIAAQLLTGPADTAVVSVLLVAKTIAMQSGDAQKGIVGTALAQPVAVKVSASDGVGVAGVSVSFAVASGGGSVSNASVSTDANGLASATWTLGASVGAQTVTASASGLGGSPVTFKADGFSVAPVKLAFTAAPPASIQAGGALPLTVTAYDAQGDVAKTFTGAVSIALSSTSSSAPLMGTLTATAVAGVASFGDVRINLPNSGYVLAASASGLAGATTGAFAVVPGPAQRLEFGPVPGATAGVLNAVSVTARDVAGNIATSFSEQVSISLLASSSAAALGGVLQVAAVAGVATFGSLSITTAGQYQLGATASGLPAAKGPAFAVFAGPAWMLVLVSGGSQSGAAGSALAQPVVIGMADRYGNRSSTPVATITFVASHTGSSTPTSGTTDAAGQRSTTWTLGATSGTQQLSASAPGLGTLHVNATAVALATPVGGGDLVVIDDVNWAADGYGLAKSGAVFNNPGNEKFVNNLVNFTPSGARASANKVLLINDRGNLDYTFTGYYWSNFGTLLSSLGLTIAQTSLHSAVTSVANDVKLVVIHTPYQYFSAPEINGLKLFASQGGRILFIGENPSYYYYQSVENALISGLGSPMTVVADCAAPGVFVTSASHALTSGIAATGSGGFYMDCASYHTSHGTGDAALFRDSASRVVGSVLKINYTPLPPSLMAPLRALHATPPELSAANAPGSPDRSTAPPRRP